MSATFNRQSALDQALAAVEEQYRRRPATRPARPRLGAQPGSRCCAEASTTPCVCITCTTCPVHGTRHCGTHD